MDAAGFMTDLWHRSIEVIRHNQAATGAYVASPNFLVYRYCWFRDGAFTAYAMDLAGELESAQRFHDWASRTILRYESRLAQCIQGARRGLAPTPQTCFHSRFTLDGMEAKEDWPNHQLDGLGAWLWAVCQHVKISGASSLPDSWQEAAALAREYLVSLWSMPCSDCWEEKADRIHTYTLAAIYGGLCAAAELLGDRRAAETAGQIRAFVLENMSRDSHLIKHLGTREVDSNLLAVATPYGLLDAEDPLMRSTVARIEQELRSPGAGLRRYGRDTYYGGGQWIVLSAWLGWHYVQVGQLERAQAIKAWVEAQAAPEGELPEQVTLDLNDASCYPQWLERWGPVASPLLWSHAMYLVLCHALRAHAPTGLPGECDHD